MRNSQEICNFATDSTNKTSKHHYMIVNLRKVSPDDSPLQFHLDDAFFAALDQEEITGGDVDVTLKVKKGAADIFNFHYTMKGSARVLCDRCLEEVSLAVDFSDSVQIAHGDPDDDNGDAIIIPFSQLTYDTAWDMYELISVHFPLQHVHPDGECNPDMISRFSTEEDSENDEF